MPIATRNDGRDADGPAQTNPFIVKETPGRVPKAMDRTQNKKKNFPAGEAGNRVPDEKPDMVQQQPVREVDRVTALRGPQQPVPKMTEKIRKKLADRLFLQDSDLPYAELEEALRKMFLAVAERQDRLAEGVLLKMNAVEYRLDDLERDRYPDDHQGGS